MIAFGEIKVPRKLQVHDKFIGPSKDIQDENIKINKIAKESYEAGVKRYNEKDYKGALDNF
jgi:hypothetical protein